MRTRANSKHVLDASVVNSTGQFFGNSNTTKSIEFSSVERARPFAATHMSNKLRRAIAVLDELASKDERQCIDRILTPAAAALPNRFEHEHDALTHIRATFGITVSECERASGSARDVFMFAVAKSLTGEELVKTLVENGSSALLASATGGVWTAERAHGTFKDIINNFEEPPMDLGHREALLDFVNKRKAEGGAPTDF